MINTFKRKGTSSSACNPLFLEVTCVEHPITLAPNVCFSSNSCTLRKGNNLAFLAFCFLLCKQRDRVFIRLLSTLWRREVKFTWLCPFLFCKVLSVQIPFLSFKFVCSSSCFLLLPTFLLLPVYNHPGNAKDKHLMPWVCHWVTSNRLYHRRAAGMLCSLRVPISLWPMF